MRPGLALGIIVLALVPLAVAQQASLQEAIDEVRGSGQVLLQGRVYAGPARVETRTEIFGVDRVTALTSDSGPILTVDAGHVALRRLRFVDADVGIHVERGALALVGPALFERVRLEVRLVEGARLVLRNDPSIPVTIEQPPGAEVIYATTGAIEAHDGATGATLGGLVVEVLRPDGSPFATYGPIPPSIVEFDVPRLARHADGTRTPLPDGWSIRAAAPGYTPRLVPSEQLGAGPLRLPLWSIAQAPPPAAEEPPALSATEAAVLATGAGAAAAVAGGALLLRSERRLWRLVALLAPLYSRLSRRDLLASPQRERIRARLQAEPGIRYRELQRALGLPNGALAHHLRILLRERLVEVTREGRAVRFYLPGARPDAPVDTGERVLAYVRAHPGATGSEIAGALELSHSLAGYHLQRLDEAGRIRRAREGVRVRAYPADRS